MNPAPPVTRIASFFVICLKNAKWLRSGSTQWAAFTGVVESRALKKAKISLLGGEGFAIKSSNHPVEKHSKKPMRTRLIASIASICFLALGNQNARAQILAVESTYSPGSDYGYGPDVTYGWKFTVGNTPIEVSHLGFFDVQLNGLVDSHQIGIWDTAGNLVVQDTVPSGTAGSLVGAYRFEPVSPTLLSANTTYHIGAHFPSLNDTALAFASAQTYASEITYLNASYSQPAGFGNPFTDFSGANHGVFGPNFQFTQFTPVPEPEHYALMMGAGLVAFACIRKRRMQRA
jgi:hypothetical protein